MRLSPNSQSFEIRSSRAGTGSAQLPRVAQAPDLIGRAQKYAADAFAFFEGFSSSSTGWHAAKQFYRASSSATSNYCAAKRGRSPAEFISKLGTVVEEIDEAVRWLEHMRDVKIAIDPELFSEAEVAQNMGRVARHCAAQRKSSATAA